jgi:hypothetical protein
MSSESELEHRRRSPARGSRARCRPRPIPAAVFSGALSVPPILIGRLKNELLAAERRVRLQAWQLEQLVSER